MQDSPFCFSCDSSCDGDPTLIEIVAVARELAKKDGENISAISFENKYYVAPNIPSDKYQLPKEISESELIDPLDKVSGSYIRSNGFRMHDARDYRSYYTSSTSDLTAGYETRIIRTKVSYNDYPRIHPICKRPQCIDNDDIMHDFSTWWFYLELGFNTFFTIELILKLVVYPDLSQWFLGHDALVNLVDVLAVVPFWLELFVSFNTFGYFYNEPLAGEVSFVKFLRMLAVLRVFKLVRNFDGASVIVLTINSAWDRIILPLFYLLVFVVVFGCLVYSIENEQSLGASQPFPEMATACWFVLVTMTTTGFGRVVPTKILTKIIAIVVMIAGNFYMAMPLTIGVYFLLIYLLLLMFFIRLLFRFTHIFFVIFCILTLQLDQRFGVITRHWLKKKLHLSKLKKQ